MTSTLRKLLILIIVAVSVIYLVYRGMFTLNLSTTYGVVISIALLIAETYGVFCVLLYCVQVWDPSEPPQQPVLPGRTVDVFVPTYNEDLMILRATLEACVRMDYPHRTFLCDDGGTEQRLNDAEKGPAARERAEKLKALCAELGVTYVTRPKNEHAKAGNLNHALRQTDGEFVIILDADHVPEPHFITRLIGYFANEKLGYVQTPHAFYNFDSFQSQNNHNERKYWEEGAMFYEVIQPGRNRWGCPIFAGSAAMFRRKALEEVGYIALETITEDMHTGLRMNALGWKALAISERLVAGQAAPDITTFHSQRLRWGEGNLSIMAHNNPLTTRGLSFSQRLCYLGSMVHWCGGVFKLVIYLTPILMMLSGVAPLKELTVALGAVTLAYLMVSLFGVKALGNGHGSIVYGEFFAMVNFWTQIRGTMRAIFKRKNQTFVVTNKRGRQSNSAWPFVYPHLVLAALSVVALGWGWSRYAYGVSDDLVRPLIPTVWIVIHLGFIWLVVRRALWPEDQRYSYRHAANVAVEYALPDGTVGCGVTNDLSDQGIGFVAYAELPVGTVLELRVIGGGEEVRSRGVVKRVTRIATDGRLGAAGFHIGVKLDPLVGTTLDAMNRLTFHYAVPRLYHEYRRGNRRMWLTNLGSFVHRTLFGQRAQNRRPVRLGAVVALDGGERFETVTEDLCPVSTAVLLPRSLRVGDAVELSVRTPLGEATGSARVVRVTEQRIGARNYHRTALKFQDPLGPGYSRVQHLLGGRAARALEPALNPDRRKPRRVPTFGAGATAALAASLLLALIGLSFPLANRDNLFLREMAQSTAPPTPEQVARLDRIYKSTVSDSYPDTDRLVLLMRAMPRAERLDECDPLIVELAARDPKNPDLRLALAAALDRKRDFAGAEVEYRALVAQAEAGKVPESRRRDIYLSGARNRVNAGDTEAALARFAAYVADRPDDTVVTNEYAGVLIRAGRHADVPALYRGADPDYGGRLLLMSALAQAKNFKAAEAEGQKILAERPNDFQAQLLLAELLAHRAEYAKARAMFKDLAVRPGATTDVRLQLARLQLLNGDFADALGQYQAVIAAGVLTDETCAGFVDAAAGVETLNESHRRTALLVDDRPETRRSTDPRFLASLAYVLGRLELYDRALPMSERAVSLNPTDTEVIRQRFALLLKQKRTTEAIALLAPYRTRDPKIQLAIVEAHLQAQEFDTAEKELRALCDRTQDPKAKALLADVLSWQKRYPESLKLFAELRAADPTNPTLPVRVAQVTLWSGDARSALKLFEALLIPTFDRADLWPDFVNAAAALADTDRLTPDQLTLVRRIADQQTVRTSDKVALLSRLGWVLVREKQPELADWFLKRAVDLKPALAADRKELARVLTGAGRPAEALRQFDGLTDLAPEDHLQLAKIHVALKDFGTAERECRVALVARPVYPEGDRLLADVLSWGGKYEESLALFRKLRAAKPADAEVLVRLAEVSIWSGEPGEALHLLATALDADLEQPRLWPTFVWAAAAVRSVPPIHVPLVGRVVAKIDSAKLTDPVALARLALVNHRIAKPEPARALVARALQAPNKSNADLREIAPLLGLLDRTAEAGALFDGKVLAAEDRAVLAELAAADRDWVNAERQFRAVLAIRPDDVPTTVRLADVISLKGNHEEARATLQPVLQKFPQDAAVLTAAGNISLRSGDPATATARFEAALKVRPDHAAARRGFVDAAAGTDQLTPAQLKLASQHADAVAASGAADPLAAGRLAWVMTRHHEVARADKLLDRCAAANVTDPAQRRELAPVFAARGRGREALAILKGLGTEPDDLLLLVTVHASLKDFPAALKECRAYLAARPDDAKGERQLADLLSWSGEYDEALRVFARLRAKAPGDAALMVRTAETLWRANRHAEAMDTFVRLLGDGMNAQAALGGGPMGAVGDPAGARAAFVLAAFEAEKVTPVILQTATLVRPAVAQSTDALLLARLGYVFQRGGRAAEADALLDRAATVYAPDDHETRWPLGGVLTLAGRRADAARAWADLPGSPEGAYRLALVYASAFDYKSALTVCDDALKLRDDRKIERLRADVLSWNRDYTAAIAALKKLHAAAPDDADLTVRLAEVHLWANLPAAALQLSEGEVLKKAGGTKAVRVFLEAAGTTGNLTVEQAALVGKCFRELPFVAETEEPVFAARVGLALRAAGATRESETMLDRATKDAPRDPRARRVLAGLLATVGRTEQAFKLYDGMDAEPGDALQLAYLNAGRKDYIAAEKAARAYLAANPADPAGERALADILSWNGDHKSALVTFERLLAARPKDAELAIRVAEVKLAAGDRAAAALVFAQALEERLGTLAAGQPAVGVLALDARVRAGFASAVAGLAKPAPRYVDLAAKLAKILPPEDTDYTTAGRLAVILARAERATEAQALADRASKIEAKEPAARRELAGIMAAVGQGRKAIMLLEGLEATPDDRLMVAGLQAASGELAAAEKTCRVALVEAPNDDRVARMLAEVLSSKKDFKESAALFEKLLKAAPADKALQQRLAEAQLCNGDFEAAAERFLPLVGPDAPPPVAANFLAAVANLKTVTPAQEKVVRQVGASDAAKGATDAGFLVNLAWVYIRCKVAEEGDAFLNAALALKPQDSAVRRNLSAVLEVRGRHAEALAAMTGLTLDDADRVRLAGLLLAGEKKDDKAAEKELRAVLDRAPAHPKARRLMVEVLIVRNEYRTALDALEKLAAEFPADREVAVRYAETLLADHKYEAALVRFRELLSVETDHPELWTGYVDAAASSTKLTPKDYELVARIEERSAATDARPAEFWSRLGWVLFQAKATAKTTKLIDRALAMKPSKPAVKRELAGVLSALTRYSEALALYDGLELLPADKVRVVELALAVKSFDRAQKELDDLLAIDPKDRNVRRLRGSLFAWTKKYPEAIKEFEALQREQPGDVEVLTGLALSHLWNGNADKALPMLHELLAKDTAKEAQWRPYLDAVAQAKTVRAEHKKVVEQVADRVEEAKVNDADLLGGLGVALAKIGQSDRAILTLKKAVQVNPSSEALKFRLAETLTAGGRFAEAEKMYKELLAPRGGGPGQP